MAVGVKPPRATTVAGATVPNYRRPWRLGTVEPATAVAHGS
jgi:hypothetical protein